MASEGNPLVSVIITTYNRNELLRRAIESALSQTYDPIEILVVDDSGTQNAGPVVTEYDVQYIYHDDNKGQPQAWYTGFQATSGEYIQFLDDDDSLKPEKIARQVSTLQNNDNVGGIYCGLMRGDIVDGEWETWQTSLPDENKRGDILRDLLAMEVYPLVTSTLLFKKDLLKKALPIRDYFACRDIALCLQIAPHTQFEIVSEPLVYKRIDQNSRWRQLGALNAQAQVIKDHRELYERFEPALYRYALAKTYDERGDRLLDNQLWSAEAIEKRLKSVYLTRGKNSRYIKKLVLSVFGRPGLLIGRYVVNTRNTD